jgi:alpha-tubulin suppressor-like RCC1 family protein
VRATLRAAAAAGLICAAVSAVAFPPSAQATSSVATAWGFNEDGELGDGTTQSSAVPVEVSGLRGVIAIAGGTHHSLALLEDGTVMAWGENFHGQLGDGTTQKSDLPVPVSGLSNVAAVAAGENHSLALLKNGSVMAWGMNSSGQLGDGGTTNSEVAVAVRGLSKVVAVSAGGSFSLALLNGGAVMAWGENFHGQLGDGSMEDSDIPVPVRLTGVRAISAGLRHGLALLSDGTVMAWGDNEAGQLGDGTEVQSNVPEVVSQLSRASAISAGKSHSLAVVASGAVVAWGDNEKGQLGDGSHTGPEHCGAPPVFACSRAPVAVTGLSQVKAIAAGGHSLALLANGAVMAWGPNNVGQLGDGSEIGPEACSPSASACSTIPVLSSTHGIVVGISTGADFSLAFGPPSLAGPLPELGRCVRVASGGGYRGASARCTAVSVTHKGHFEWLPGPGPKANFEERLSEPKLETVGGRNLNCVSGFAEGEYTGPKTETIGHLTLNGCRDVNSNTSCQSNRSEEGVIMAALPLEGDLAFTMGGARSRIGWDIRPKPPATSLVTFDCGSGMSAAAVVLEGSAIGRATPIDQMVSAFELQYKQRGGKQIPELNQGGPRHILNLTTTPIIGVTTSEQVGLQSTTLRTSEEPLEIKAKA